MIFAITHQGLKRESNEDQFFVKEADRGSFDVVEGDLILLSTDGLHGELPL